jgi:hypothetical protein
MSIAASRVKRRRSDKLMLSDRIGEADMAIRAERGSHRGLSSRGWRALISDRQADAASSSVLLRTFWCSKTGTKNSPSRRRGRRNGGRGREPKKAEGRGKEQREEETHADRWHRLRAVLFFSKSSGLFLVFKVGNGRQRTASQSKW